MCFISVRCALNPPPCFLLLLFGGQVGELQNQPKRNANTIAKNVMADKWADAKSNQKSIQKLTKIIENRVWDHPRGSRGRLGDQFGPRAAQGSKRAPKGCEILVRFWHQNGDSVQLFVVFVFSCFLRRSHGRFFMFLGARGLYFGFHFGSTLRALGLWGNS